MVAMGDAAGGAGVDRIWRCAGICERDTGVFSAAGAAIVERIIFFERVVLKRIGERLGERRSARVAGTGAGTADGGCRNALRLAASAGRNGGIASGTGRDSGRRSPRRNSTADSDVKRRGGEVRDWHF